jgi:hypothetical protein
MKNTSSSTVSTRKKVRFSPTSHEQYTQNDKNVVRPVDTKTHDSIGQTKQDYLLIIKQLFNPPNSRIPLNDPKRFAHLGSLDAYRLRTARKNIHNLCKRINESPSNNDKGKYIKYPVLIGGGRGINIVLTHQHIPFIVKFLTPVIRSYIKLA